MAHFAKISEANEVLHVVVLDNENCQDENGAESEAVGQQFLESKIMWPANLWIQTSYNTHANQHRLGGTPFRGNMAMRGDTWDPSNQIFWAPQPYPSWSKDIPTASWKSPIGDAPALTSEQENSTVPVYHYVWDEENKAWDVVTQPYKEELQS